jgi:MSHA biogenesis protein MshQ
LSYPGAANGTSVTVSLTSATTAAANPVTCSGGSCATIFNTAGFVFSSAADGAAVTMPTQVAGSSSGTYYLRAVKTNAATMACQSALTGGANS